MKKYIILMTAATALVSYNSQAQKKTADKTKMTADGYTVLPSGLEYKFLKDLPGKVGNVGEQMEMNFKSQVGDSVLFDSKEMMKGKPVLFTLQKGRFNADVNEGLLLMSDGDIAVFRTPLDSIMKTGEALMPWMNHKDKMVYTVEALSIKTREQVEKEFKEKQDALISKEDKELNDYFKANNLKPTKTESGLYYLVTKKGTGEKPKVGQQVSVNYTGKTMDGKVFDSNVDSAFHHVQEFAFPLGHGRVIKGWDEGIALLNKGEKATLYIPSRYAYGAHSPSPAIPENAILIFDVELVNISGEPVEPQKPQPHTHSEHDGHQH
jgi:FKBP-type peptidyl-prolyl cis-trans isomerase